jgi:hydrogenase maturation protease
MGWRAAQSMLGNMHSVARLSYPMKTIIVGLGNPILGDDGIGWKIAEKIKQQLGPVSHVDVEFLSLGGISLMEHLIGYERAILIDAVTSDQETGSVIVSKLNEMPDHSAFHITSAHDTSLQNALKLGREMGAKLPEDVIIVGIATEHIYDFSEQLSPLVSVSIPKAIKFVINLL